MKAIYSLVYKMMSHCEIPKNKWPVEKLVKNLKIAYKNNLGRELNIDNPVFFTEKLQWYKVYYNNQNLTRAVDKFLFKEYIREKLGEGYTIPFFGAWTKVSDFSRDWDKLPETFILKSTVQSDGKFIKVIKKKSEVNKKDLLKEVKQWLVVKNTLINSYCRAYYDAVPRILAEQYVEQIDNQLYDYKFFCFNGKPFCAYAAKDHFEGDKNNIDDYPISFYNLNWEKLDVQYGHHKTDFIPAPIHLEEMKEIASILSKDFPFVRVDFFETQEKLYVAELTFYPGGGFVEYHPLSFDRQLGDMFDLPLNGCEI